MPHRTGPHQCYAADLRILFDDELSDLEARWAWIKVQPDLDHPDDSRTIADIHLEAIEREWDRRRRHNLKSPTPSYGIPEDLIAQLKCDANIVAIIGDDVDLKRAGRDWRGACALCGADNKTTLAVSNDPPLWHCFRCGMGGDIFTWLMAYQRVAFPDAVRWLCGLLGQPIREREQRRVSCLRTREVRHAG